MALQTKTITANGSKGHHKFTLTVTENSTSISANSSAVAWKLEISPIRNSYDWISNQGKVKYSVTVNGSTYSGIIATYDGVSTVTIKSGALTCPHNADGSKTISCSFSITDSTGWSFAPGNASASGTMALTNIPRSATITSAPDFNDEENPTITYSNPAGAVVSRLRACISLTGDVDDIAYRDISTSGTSYTFNLTDAEREVLRANTNSGSTTRKVYFYIATTIGTEVYRTSVVRTLTIINAMPQMQVNLWDSNPTTAALTGNTDHFIRGHSVASYAISAAPVKGATIAKYYATMSGEVRLEGATGEFPNVSSGNFAFSIVDSRGNQPREEIKRDFIDYIDVTCSPKISIELEGETAAKIKVEATGSYYRGSFGAVDNTLTLEACYKENDGNFTNWVPLASGTVTYDGNTYNCKASFSVPNYDSSYVVVVRAVDKLTKAQAPGYRVKLIPVFDWGESDFNFNVPVSIQGDPLADMIIEQGTTDDNWWYRKYKSGVMECWRRLGVTTDIKTAWGSLYSSGYLTETNLKYPVAFITYPTLNVTLSTRSAGALLMVPGGAGNNIESATHTGAFELVRGTVLNGGTYILNYHAIGRWKW